MLYNSQLLLLSPPHLQAPTIGPFRARPLMMAWGWGEAWAGRQGDWAGQSLPSPGRALGVAGSWDYLLPPGSHCLGLGAWWCLGQKSGKRKILQYPASQPWSSVVHGVHVNKTHTTVGFIFCHTVMVCVCRGEGMLQECVRTLCPVSGCQCWHPVFSWWSMKLLQNTFKTKLVHVGRCWIQCRSVSWCLVGSFLSSLKVTPPPLESTEMRHRRLPVSGVPTPASMACLPTLSFPWHLLFLSSRLVCLTNQTSFLSTVW